MPEKNTKIIIAAVILITILVGFFYFSNRQNSTSNKQVQIDNGSEDIEILAGKNSFYMEFNQADYESALKSGKIIFLDFFANWCPICREEAPEIKAGFDNLTTDRVIGFRVNYNDSDTDKDEKELAEKFGITYQHTKVILKQGMVVLKDLESWDRQKFAEEINKLL